MGNPLKQIVCHFDFVLFFLSVVQASFFCGLPKQVLGCSCDFLSTREKFKLIILREKNSVLLLQSIGAICEDRKCHCTLESSRIRL